MVKKIINIIFYFGFLFFGGGFLISLGQFVLYNGMGDIFEYVEPESINFTIQSDTINQKERYTINYFYLVDDKQYNAKDVFYTNYIKKGAKNLEKLYYNKRIPSVIYVDNNHLDVKRSKINMLVMGFFFLFILLIYKFADLDKWIGVYTRGEYKRTKKL